MERELHAEWLDTLPVTDAGALKSRADLRRLNRLMGHARIVGNALKRSAPVEVASWRIADIGCGDGTFAGELSRILSKSSMRSEITLVDRQPCIAASTINEMEEHGWSVRQIASDIFEWLENEGAEVFDCMIANLFVHHFDAIGIRRLFEGIAKRASLFVACEPRRATFPLFATKCLGLIGCKAVTRHDAAVSVQAGFAGSELSDIWPVEDWEIWEKKAGLFSHLFVARKLNTLALDRTGENLR